MEYPDVNNVYSPTQVVENDVPKLLFDINNCAESFPLTNEVRLHRARAIAPIFIGQEQIPVAPLPNPLTGPSHHIIRLMVEDRPFVNVDLLFNDTTLYFIGFRRCVITLSEEGVEVENAGRWFVYNDMYNAAPAYLNPVKMGINSSHVGKDLTKIGGSASMIQLFYTLANFEENVEIESKMDSDLNQQVDSVKELLGGLKRQLKKVVARVIVTFCEAVRLRSIYNEVLARFIRGDQTATALSERLWKLINNWGQLSEYAQKMRKDGTMTLKRVLTQIEFGEYGFPTMTLADIIGPQGELTLCKHESTLFITPQKLRRIKGKDLYVEDPMFEQAEEEEDNEMAAAAGRGRGRGRGRGV